MRITRISMLVLVVAAFAYAAPAEAQFGFIKKAGKAISSKVDGKSNSADDDVNAVANRVSDRNDAADAAPNPEPRKLRDDEPAVFRTTLPVQEAVAKVKAYFDDKNIDYDVDADTNKLSTDWYGERRCGIGWNRCADRAVVRFTADGSTTVTVRVMGRKREAGINDKPWVEGTQSKGKETAAMAMELEQLLH